jgi:GNAT superfamily N-acetyltransferase
VVRSDVKRQGLGTLLLRKLVDYCRGRGTRRLEGEVLAENAPMLELVKSFGGFRMADSVEEGTVRIALPLS